MNETILTELDSYVKAALAKKAEDPVLLDVHDLTSIADYFLIVSGRSHRLVTAIAEHVVKELKNKNIHPLSVEGLKEGHWVLIDYGDVVIHVFLDSIRRFYDLESLWIDAKRIRTPSMMSLRDNDDRNGEVDEIFIE
jgi:ribosome-associated protein